MSDENLDWKAVKKHFDELRQEYMNLEGVPGVNSTFALRIIFDPIARRYNSGERTKELFDLMTNIE